MKKIPTIFIRNPENMGEILTDINPECQWVFDNQGAAHQKLDGTCVKIEKGKYYKRREVKKNKHIPSEFIQENFDENTGKRMGWMQVNTSNEDQWHIEGLKNTPNPEDGTYELVGPRISKNPENQEKHVLLKHSETLIYKNIVRTFEGIKEFLKDKDIEGIVFKHEDGRMAKIKKKDFKLKRK